MLIVLLFFFVVCSVVYDVRRFEESTMDNAVKSHGGQLDLVFFILPNNQLRRYAEVKHYCTLKLGSK